MLTVTPIDRGDSVIQRALKLNRNFENVKSELDSLVIQSITASQGLTLVGEDVQLGGTVNGIVTVTADDDGDSVNFISSSVGANISLFARNSGDVFIGTREVSANTLVTGFDFSSDVVNDSHKVTFTDSRGTPTGIEYSGDYSTTFTDRSLVDKGYADSLTSVAELALAATTVDMTANNRTIFSRTVTGTENITITNPVAGGTFTIIATGGTAITVNSQTPEGDTYVPGSDNVIDVRCVRTSPVKYIVTNNAG